MHCPSEVHLKATKRVVLYIKGTITYGVMFRRSQPVKLFGYSNSYWGGSKDDTKRTSGHYFSVSYGIFSWSCKKQDIVAQSTAEVEFLAATTVKIDITNITMMIDLTDATDTERLCDGTI
ncbi:hypothetical protein BC332_12900 [Capsicum chinense]|nr:hypothetical protein BC332_12900 [Capsicum chinense]